MDKVDQVYNKLVPLKPGDRVEFLCECGSTYRGTIMAVNPTYPLFPTHKEFIQYDEPCEVKGCDWFRWWVPTSNAIRRINVN